MRLPENYTSFVAKALPCRAERQTGLFAELPLSPRCVLDLPDFPCHFLACSEEQGGHRDLEEFSESEQLVDVQTNAPVLKV
jgi:hypothetical protein